MSCGSVVNCRYKFVNPQTVSCRTKHERVSKFLQIKYKYDSDSMFCQVE